MSTVRALLVCNAPGCDPLADHEGRDPEQAVYGPVEGAEADRIGELAQAEGWVRLPGGSDYCPKCARRAGLKGDA